MLSDLKPRWARRSLAAPHPDREALIPPVVLLDLRDDPQPEAAHAAALRLCDAQRSGVRLLLISAAPLLADARIHPGTLHVSVQYAGVHLLDPAWQAVHGPALHLPADAGLQLAVLFGVRALNEDNAAPVLQVARTPLIPGVPCLDLAALADALNALNVA